MEVQALVRHVPGSPQKVRRILDLVRGKSVEEALNILRFLPQPSAKVVAKVVKSAAANAENNFQLSPAGLRIVYITADKGMTLKRARAKARGRISPILKRTSHIKVVVAGED